MNPRLRNEALIYTNWRGKNFIIDQAFVDDLKRLCEADGLEPGEMDFLTPEMLLEMLPTMESIRRYEQLEEMWEQVGHQ